MVIKNIMRVEETKTKIYLLKNILTRLDHIWRMENSVKYERKLNFISSNNDIGETRSINILSHNGEIMLGSSTDDIIINLFISLLDNYQ